MKQHRSTPDTSSKRLFERSLRQGAEWAERLWRVSGPGYCTACRLSQHRVARMVETWVGRRLEYTTDQTGQRRLRRIYHTSPLCIRCVGTMGIAEPLPRELRMAL